MKHKFKVGQRCILKTKYKTEQVVIMNFIGGNTFKQSETTTAANVLRVGSVKGAKSLWLPLDMIKPLGQCLIKKTRNGQFRYHTVSWNNEKLQTSEPLEDKSHVKRMAKFYFPDFEIVDKTKG